MHAPSLSITKHFLPIQLSISSWIGNNQTSTAQNSDEREQTKERPQDRILGKILFEILRVKLLSDIQDTN